MTARVAAASLVYLFGDADPVPPPPTMELRLLAETATTITLGWDPVPGAIGYRFSAEGSDKMPHTWNPLFRRHTQWPACNTDFVKGHAWYMVEALSVKDLDTYP